MRNRRKGSANQEKKEWLLRYRELLDEVERETERAGFWQEKAKGLSSFRFEPTGIKSTSRINPVEEMLIVAEHCSQLAREAEVKKMEIKRAIGKLKNTDYRVLLSYRYLDRMDFEQIACKMHYSIGYVWTMHGRALQEIKIPEKSSE